MNNKKIFIVLYWIICIELCLQGVSIYLRHTYAGRFACSPQNFIPFVEYLYDFYGQPNKTKKYTSHDRYLGDRLSRAKEYEPHAQAIWLFGGSTMNGGFSSKKTSKGNIPDVLARRLSRGKQHYNVYDIGAGSYSIQQERILFLELLRRHPRPRIVIFYDGYNEFSTPPNRIGYPSEYHSLKNLYFGLFDPNRFIEEFTMRRCKTLYVLDSMLNIRFNTHLQDKDPFALELKPHESPVSAIAHNYLFNVSIIQAVCRTFKITPIFITQPVIMTKEHLSPQEQKLNINNETKKEDFKTFIAQVSAGMTGYYLDLSSIFSNNKDTIYLDNCHIDESSTGHTMIVNALYSYMIKHRILNK